MAEKLEVIVSAKDEFSKVFEKFQSGLSPITNNLKLIAGAALAAAGGAGFTALLNATVKQQAEFAELEKRLGFTSDTMSKLGFFAEKTGGSVDDMTRSLQFMLRNTSEASSGNEKMLKTLDDLGLSIGNLRNQSPDEIFKAYLTSLGNVENKADRARLAMEVFGRGGGAMLKVLNEGADGFAKISAEAERFGMVVSSQAAANAHEFEESHKLISLAIQGIRNALFEDLVPYFTAAFHTLAYWIADNRVKIVGWATGFVTLMGDATQAVVRWGARTIDIYYAVGAAMSKMAVSSKQNEIKAAFKELEDVALRTKKVTEEIAAAEAKGDNLNWVVYAEAKRKELVKLQDESEGLKTKINGLNMEYQQLVDTWTADSSKMFNEAEVTAFFESLKKGMADWKAAGTADVPELKAPGMQVGISDKIQGEIDSLKQMWAGYYTTLGEQAAVWRDQEISKVRGNKQALLMIEDIYQAKLDEIKQKERDAENEYLKSIETQYVHKRLLGEEFHMSEMAKLTVWYQQQLEMYGAYEEARAQIENIYNENKKVARQADADNQTQVLTEQLAVYANFMGGMAALSASMGKKGFLLAKALNIGQAIMSTYAGAANALKDYPYPYNLVAAAAVIAFGMAQVVKIASQQPPGAKAGIDYVPQDQTYSLHKGERVVPAQTNKDLKEFLGNGGGGGSVTVGSVAISFPNIRSADDLKGMSDREWQDVIEQKMIPNMRRLAGAGISV